MHKDLKMDNIYAVNTNDLELVDLAIGDFGGAQKGEEKVSGHSPLVLGLGHRVEIHQEVGRSLSSLRNLTFPLPSRMIVSRADCCCVLGESHGD